MINFLKRLQLIWNDFKTPLNTQFNHPENIIILFFLTVITGIAVYTTGFNTILLPGLAIIAILLKRYPLKIIFFELVKYFTYISIVTILMNLKYFNNDFTINIIAWGDKSFYAQVSAFINKTGIETYYFDYINTQIRKPIPYHYGENWVTILFTQLFKINEFYSQELLSIPFLTGTTLYFLTSIFKNIGYKFPHSLLISLITLLFVGIPYINYNFIPVLGNMINQFQINPIEHNKYIFSVTLLTFLFYTLSINNWKISAISVLISLFSFLCCISFINILIVSTIFFMFDKQINSKNKIFIAGVVLLSILFFTNFYFFKNSYSEASNYSATDFSFFYFCISPIIYIKTFFNIIFKSVLQLCIVFLPIILLILFLSRYYEIYKKYNNLIKFTIVLLLSGLSLWAILWFSIGSISLFIDASFWAFKLAVFLIFFLELKKYLQVYFILKIFSIISLIIVLPLLYNIIFKNSYTENQDILSLKEKLIINKNEPFIYLRVYNPNETFYKKNLLAAVSYGPISNLNAKQHGIFVDLEKIKYSNDCLTAYREKPLVNTSCFYRYCKENNFNDYYEGLINLINDYGIKYIIKDLHYKEPSITDNLKTKKIYSNSLIEILEII